MEGKFTISYSISYVTLTSETVTATLGTILTTTALKASLLYPPNGHGTLWMEETKLSPATLAPAEGIRQ